MSDTTQRANGNRAAARAGIRPPGAGAPRRSKVRVPELAVGLVVTVGFALAAVLWQLSAVRKDPALALAAPVDRGQIIEAGDVRVIYLASDDPIARLGEEEAGQIVGRVAVADLAPGTILGPGHVVGEASPGPGEGVVGLSLQPGQYPSAGLRTGDLVNVVAAPDGGNAAGGLVAEGAEVVSVEELDSQGRRFVSILLAESAANDVAVAAERGAVRLVQVGG